MLKTNWKLSPSLHLIQKVMHYKWGTYWLVFLEAENLCFANCSPEAGIHLKSLQLVNKKMQVQMQAPHFPQCSLSTLANCFRNSTITNWRTMVNLRIIKNNFLLNKPFNMFFSSCLAFIHWRLDKWEVLKISVFFTFSSAPKIDLVLNCIIS